MPVRSPSLGALARRLAARGAQVGTEGDHGLLVTGLDAPGDLAAEHAIIVHELTPKHTTLEEAYLELNQASFEYHATAPAAGT